MTFAHFSSRTREKQVLVITGGHPFDAQTFFAMLDAVIVDRLGYNWCLASQSVAHSLIEDPNIIEQFAAILFYDVPGQDYRTGQPPLKFEPTQAYKAGLETLLEAGKPMLFLHHAIIGWPLWMRYSDIIGGCVMTSPGMLHGRQVADSGYRFDVTHRLTPVGDHPILKHLESGFEITDQLYMGEVFEETLTPLLRSDYDFSPNGFYSLAAAAQGNINSNEGWSRNPGSNIMAWAREEKNSSIVYIQCGDGPPAYANDGFRTLVGNALEWLCTGNVN